MGRILSLLAVLAGGIMMWAIDDTTVIYVNSVGVALMAVGVVGFLLTLWLGDRVR